MVGLVFEESCSETNMNKKLRFIPSRSFWISEPVDVANIEISVVAQQEPSRTKMANKYRGPRMIFFNITSNKIVSAHFAHIFILMERSTRWRIALMVYVAFEGIIIIKIHIPPGPAK